MWPQGRRVGGLCLLCPWVVLIGGFKVKKNKLPVYLRALSWSHFFCLFDFFFGVLQLSGHIARGYVLCQVAASRSWAGNILVPPYPEWGVLACTVKHTLFQTDIWWKEVMLILHFSHKLTTVKTSCSLTQQCCILWRDPRRRDAPLYVHRLFPGDDISSGNICYCCTVAYFDLNDKGLQLIRNDVYHCHILQQGRDFTYRPLPIDKSLSPGLA